MPIEDKVAAAKKISELLNNIFAAGDFRLRYKITVDPQVGAEREWERPEILVELSGSDSSLALENGGELLRAIEHVSLEMLRLAPDEHEKISFRLSEFPFRPLAGASPGCRRSRRTSPRNQHAVCVRSHVVARAPHPAPGFERP